MSDINPERGEVSILLGGKPYPMRPSYEAMQAIEQDLEPLLSLVTRLAHPLKRLSVREMAIIVTEAIHSAGKERDDAMLKGVSVEKVGELIYEQGVVNCIDPIEAVLLNMITGGKKSDGKKKRSAKSKKGSTTGD